MDGVIRSYSDIEEFLFDRWISIMEQSPCIYSIEQSLTVKKYLERNPDKRSIFKKLVEKGQIELLGGGEAIIDTNLVDGESIVRNHLYSILWYREQFGIKPTHATVHDTFGMSSQLPQIFRKLGYRALMGFSYTGKNERPYWKGINGDLLYLLRGYGDMGLPVLYIGEYNKLPVCTSCLGHGCKSCNFSGIDYSFGRKSIEDIIDEKFKQLSLSDHDTAILVFSTEEAANREDLPKQLEIYAAKYHVELEYTSDWKLLNSYASHYIQALASSDETNSSDCVNAADLINATNSISEEYIDKKTDWNPACTGVYVTRIEIKKMVRKLEGQLLSCEKFAAFAADYGMIYPVKKLQNLWSIMAIIQSHDGVTSTHSDGAYNELMELGRNVSQGAYRIYLEAMESLEKSITVPQKDGYIPFILFNPLGWSLSDSLLEACLVLPGTDDLTCLTASDIEVLDYNNKPQTVTGVSVTKNYADYTILVQFKGSALPPVGYKTFFFKIRSSHKSHGMHDHALLPASLSRRIGINEKCCIENEFYRIDLKGNAILGVYDKKIGEYVLGLNANDIIIENDTGSPWETLVPPAFRERLCSPDYFENLLPSDYHVETYVEQDQESSLIIRKGIYRNTPRKIKQVAWKQGMKLYRGIDKVFFKTEIDWDAASCRIRLAFPLTFKPQNDEAYYEIPYGIIKRKAYRPSYGSYTCSNGDWPALNFTACINHNLNYTVGILNKGIPSYTVKDGTIYLSVLRSPEEFFCGFNLEGARDTGKHCFEYALISGRGGLKQIDIVKKGKEFNTDLASCAAVPKKASLPPVHSFFRNSHDGIILSSIKRAEIGSDLIIRAYEAYGEPSSDKVFIDGGNNLPVLTECNLLEDNEKSLDDGFLSYGLFEIKTLRIKQPAAHDTTFQPIP